MFTLNAESIVDAFIENNDKFLMIHRAKDRKYYPDYWASIGGGIELNEVSTPISACLRELNEETGINSESIVDLSLRYVIVSKKRDMFFNHYIYFGKSLTTDVVECDEGNLEWIHKSQLLELKLTQHFRTIITHYLADAINDNLIYLGTVDRDNNLSFGVLNENRS